MNTPAAAATVTASSTSLASVQRHRPKPWVQAYRKVPVSISRASTGAPANAPISAGTACSMKPLARKPFVPSKAVTIFGQASEFAGWQAVIAAA